MLFLCLELLFIILLYTGNVIDKQSYTSINASRMPIHTSITTYSNESRSNSSDESRDCAQCNGTAAAAAAYVGGLGTVQELPAVVQNWRKHTKAMNWNVLDIMNMVSTTY